MKVWVAPTTSGAAHLFEDCSHLRGVATQVEAERVGQPGDGWVRVLAGPARVVNRTERPRPVGPPSPGTRLLVCARCRRLALRTFPRLPIERVPT